MRDPSGKVWVDEQAKAVVDARFPANDFQKEMMSVVDGSLAGATFHLVQGAVTVIGLMTDILLVSTNNDQTSLKTKSD